MTGVRWRPEGYEGHCDACGEWWPLSPEWWQANSGLRRCRACVLERRKLQQRKARPQRPTPVTADLRAYKREWMRRYRRRLAEMEAA